MRIKTIIGWCTLLIISFLPALIWYIFRPVHTSLANYSDLTHALGQIAALTGMTMFALTFVLSTRLKFIEDIFGGLDKVYVIHAIIGATALMLLVFHPILLVLKFIPNNVGLAAAYLLPGAFWSVNFGIIALLGLIFLIYITLFTGLRYNYWKISHRFLGLIFIFAVLHIFLVRGVASRDSIFAGYYVFAGIVSAIGIASFLFALIANNTGVREAIYRIESIDKKKKGFYTINLVPVYKPIRYKSGQFIFLRFYNEKLSREAHPFSIASKTNSQNIKIVIKDLGDFTSRLYQLKEGDRVAVEGPYGRFNKSSNCDQVWIAGGIGITPFIGMAADLKNNAGCKVDLYYSVKDKEDFVAIDYLKSLEESNHRFKLFPWMSSESGHLQIRYISENSRGFFGKEIYLCGPRGFKNGMRRGLVKAGVSRDKIFEEEFSLR